MRKAFFQTRLLPALAGLSATALVLLATRFLIGVQRDNAAWERRLMVLERLNGVRVAVESALKSRIYQTRTLALYAAFRRPITRYEFCEHARSLLARDKSALAVQMVRGDAVALVHSDHFSGTRPLAPLSPLFLGKDREKPTPLEPVIAGPLTLGDKQVLLCLTLLPRGDVEGEPREEVALAFDANALLLASGTRFPRLGRLLFALKGHVDKGVPGKVFWGDPRVFELSPAETNITFPGGPWILGAAPENGWEDVERARMMWIIGYLLAIMAGGLAWVATRYPMELKQEIVERVRAEREVRAAARDYENLYRTASVGLFRSPLDGDRLSRANQAMATIFGYASPEDCALNFDFSKRFADPADRVEMTRLLRERGEIGDYEFQALRRDGSSIFLSINATAYPKEGFFEGAILDITRRKEAEKDREDVERLIRHDLKSPLSGIVTLPAILKTQANLTDEQKRLMGEIENAGNRMLQMINLSQDLYKMEQGIYLCEPDPVDILKTLRGIIGEKIEIWSDIAEKRFVLTLNDAIPGPDEKVEVAGKELLYYTAFSNVINNAVEASPEDRPISVTLTDDGDGPIRTVIHNFGAVPKTIRDRFFDKYVTSGKRNGTGLGTYSARLIIQSLGGEIVMRTCERDGTTLTITLPRFLKRKLLNAETVDASYGGDRLADAQS